MGKERKGLGQVWKKIVSPGGMGGSSTSTLRGQCGPGENFVGYVYRYAVFDIKSQVSNYTHKKNSFWEKGEQWEADL